MRDKRETVLSSEGIAGELAEAREQIAELRQALESKDREIACMRRPANSTHDGNIHPENLVWMFGSGRTGSNWLMRMIGESAGCARWEEPRIGSLFAFYYSQAGDRKNKHFILGLPYKETWLKSVRSFILKGASVRFPEIGEGGYLVIREPTSSNGAPLLMEALPESRMIFLIRDPRDIVASSLAGSRKGGWLYERHFQSNRERHYAEAEKNPDAFVRRRANMCLQHVNGAKQAYEAHGGYKVLVKYEDLIDNPLATMQYLYSTLEIPVNEEVLARTVEKHSWKNIPKDKKGEGKFHRKGISGGWREDLTSEQVEIVESVTAPLLDEFYPA